MPNDVSHHERYQREREYARYVRARQGRTTDLDRAEARFEKLTRFLLAARFLAPLLLACGMALSAGQRWIDCWAIMMWMLGTNFIAVLASSIARPVFGAGFGELLYHAGLTLGGFVFLLIPNGPPVKLPIAIVLMAAPSCWWILSRIVTANTAYVRLMRAAEADDVIPRIIE